MSISITTISIQRLHAMWNDGIKINLINVSIAAEYRAGHVAGDRLIPSEELSVETLVTDELWQSSI